MTAAPLHLDPVLLDPALLDPALLDAAPLPRRAAADPTDETEWLVDYGLLGTVLDGLLAGELEACGGLLVVHADGSHECLEADDCPRDLVLHAGTASCADAGLDCC